MKHLLLILSTILLIGCQNQTQKKLAEVKPDPVAHNKVIYGPDNRLDWYEETDQELLELADSTVALMKSSTLSTSGGSNYKVLGQNFGGEYNLCSSEPFRDQDTAAFCSGFLVDDDIIVSAGHCVTNAKDCQSVRFVFGFALKQKGVLPQNVDASEVYSCAELIHTQQNPNNSDFSVIRLDRKVTNHKPLAIRHSGSIAVNTPIVVMGHPAGLPNKISAGANVRSTSPLAYFVANLDTYGGNSGSAVFNADTGEVEGILVRGETDFTYQNGCYASNVCTNTGCRGEDVTRITEVLNYLRQSPMNNEYFQSQQQVLIPDNNKAGIESGIQVPSSPNGRSVVLHVDIRHSWIGDLKIQLVAPDKSVYLLHNRSGRNQHDIRGTYGVDLTPATDLEGLKQLRTKGEWKLQIFDLANQDVGSLNSWAIEFKED